MVTIKFINVINSLLAVGYGKDASSFLQLIQTSKRIG